MKVKDTVDTLFPVFTTVVSVNDVTKATITEVTGVTNTDKATSITVNFSEPIASGAAFKVNGVSATAPYSAGATSVTVSVPSGLAVGTTHKIEVVNLTDLSGNVNAVVSKEFTVTKDVAAPAVQSVEALGDNQLLVTFNKDMKKDAAALANLTSNIKVKSDVYADVTVSSVTPLDSTTKRQFVVQLLKTGAVSPAVAADDLFTTSKTSHNLTVLFVDNTIEDYLGNKLAGTSKTVTITKDNTSPEVTGVTYKKDSTGKVTSVVVNFSEGLKANPALAFPSSLVDQNGVVVATSSVLNTIGAANVAAGAKSAEFVLGTPQTVSGKYSVTFAAGWVEDTSIAENDSKSHTAVVDFGSTQTSSEFTIPAANVSVSGDVITVVFPEAVKGGAVAGSATDPSRYTINGKALPAGTTITLNAAGVPAPGTVAQTIATITLPDQSIDTTDTAAIFTINGVVSLTNKTNKSFTKTITVTDNIDPTLNSAVLNSDGTITVGFDETLGTNPVAADFVLTLNGLTVANTEYTVTPGVGSDAGKYVVTLTQQFDALGDADPTNDVLFVDLNGDGGFDAGEIVITTGAANGALVAADNTSVSLKNAVFTSAKIGTIASGTPIGKDAANNTLKLNVVKTVK
ncbi:hypothetical protein [Neobacillus sp.]|uniref:hypothetical protein n=1 Tax=Neobacillus sp. TaxID=2675273 RepID=UPI0035B52216